MDFIYWIQISTAVVFGNLIFSLWAYSAFRIHKYDKAGIKGEDMPLWLLALITGPFLLIGGVVYFLP